MEKNAEGLKALGLKIETLAKNVGGLTPDGRNQFSKYDYITANQMMKHLRENLLEVGLSILPNVESYEERDYTSADGRVTIRTVVNMSFTIIDLETGYSQVLNFVGAEQDTGGKSFQQAITQATKYFLFKLLKTSSDTDADGDAKTTTTYSASNYSDTTDSGDAKEWIDEKHPKWGAIVEWVAKGNDVNRVRDKYKVSKASFTALKKQGAELIINQEEL